MFSLGTGVLAIVATLVGLVIFLVPAIFFVLMVQRLLGRCAPESRTLDPVLAWLLLVPLVNLVMMFVVVLNVTKTLQNEFARRGIVDEPNPGQNLGLATAILGCCGFIPLLGMVASVAALVCWVLYWIKLSGYAERLA